MLFQTWEFKSKNRGYALLLGFDLFEDLILTRRWWGLKTRKYGQMIEPVPDLATAEKRIQCEIRRRAKRGYVLVTP